MLANIVADVIIAMLPFLLDRLEEGGTLLLSGIIDTREEDVLAALEKESQKVAKRLEDGGWVAVSNVIRSE